MRLLVINLTIDLFYPIKISMKYQWFSMCMKIIIRICLITYFSLRYHLWIYQFHLIYWTFFLFLKNWAKMSDLLHHIYPSKWANCSKNHQQQATKNISITRTVLLVWIIRKYLGMHYTTGVLWYISFSSFS